jgi:hypothetical protein
MKFKMKTRQEELKANKNTSFTTRTQSKDATIETSSNFMIVDHLTIKTPGEVADKASDPPAAMDKIPLYSDFFTRPELYQRIHVHIVRVRPKDPHDSNAGLYAKGILGRGLFGSKVLIDHVSPKVTVDTYGAKTGSTDYFPIGKHAFLVSTLKMLCPDRQRRLHFYLAACYYLCYYGYSTISSGHLIHNNTSHMSHIFLA